MKGCVKCLRIYKYFTDYAGLSLSHLALVLLILFPISGYAEDFQVNIETSTNGVDADAAPGLEILVESEVSWSFVVTNIGVDTIPTIRIRNFIPDRIDGAVGERTDVCSIGNLTPGSNADCTLTGYASEGQYQNKGIAIAYDQLNREVDRDTDLSHYIGILGNPSINLEKYTEGQDADTSPGPQLKAEDSVSWLFEVINTGDVDLTNIQVTDLQLLPTESESKVVCVISDLAINERKTCSFSDVVVEGQYENLGKVTADAVGGVIVSDEDMSHYEGIPASSLTSQPRARPTTGDAPLTVIFTPDAITDNAISNYEWDFDGNGSYDRSESVGRDQEYTFAVPGEYSSALRVTDSDGDQDVGTVLISVTNKPPEVSATATPSNGQLPLSVEFTATSSDSDGIISYEWDFDGDGNFDFSTSSTTTAYEYLSMGDYQAYVRVTDGAGGSTIKGGNSLFIRVGESGTPSVILNASPTSGDAPLVVNLSTEVSDPDGDEITQYDWDDDGDGVFEDIGGTSNKSVTYYAAGTSYPSVRITDSSGQSSIDSTEIKVNPEIALSITQGTIDPYLNENSKITTTLGSELEMSLIIEDKYGQLIRTIVPFSSRSAGSYSDYWDGTTDENVIVTEGEYRAVLLYHIDDRTERFDLSLTSGGDQSNPYRSSIPSVFYPMNHDPLDITFTLNEAAEVTAFMGLFHVNTRLVTFMQREPLGKGSYVIYWNGEDENGQLVEKPDNDDFLFGIYQYSLADNAIYVSGGVHVLSVEVDHSILQPSQFSAYEATNVSELTVELSRAGAVKLIVNDVESGEDVAVYEYENLSAGINYITWNGKNNDGDMLPAGLYRLGLTGVDQNGHKSLSVYALQRIYY